MGKEKVRSHRLSWLVALLVLALFTDRVVAQEGQGNAILSMGGDCRIGGSIDIQIRGCVPERSRGFLLADLEPGTFEHPLGTFAVPFSPELLIHKARFDAEGVAFFWLMIPDRADLVGRTMTLQGAFFDDDAPEGLAITNRICFPLCEPEASYSCENGIARLEGLLVTEPVEADPTKAVFRLATGGEMMGQVEFEFDLPGPMDPVQTEDGMIRVTRVSAIDPCQLGQLSRLAVQFIVDASSLPGGILPDSTTFEIEGAGSLVSRTIDTSCGAPIGVGIRYRPLIITCIEEQVRGEIDELETFTQGGWGTRCRGNNPGCFRDAHFEDVFPDGVLLGDADGLDGDDEFALLFTSSAAVEAFLPHGSTAGALSQDQTDPTSSTAGVLAGQLLAATLNVGFNDAGLLGDVAGAYGDLLYVANVDDALLGLSVREVLALANLAIAAGPGALPPDVVFSDLVEALTDLNEANGSTFGL